MSGNPIFTPAANVENKASVDVMTGVVPIKLGSITLLNVNMPARANGTEQKVGISDSPEDLSKSAKGPTGYDTVTITPETAAKPVLVLGKSRVPIFPDAGGHYRLRRSKAPTYIEWDRESELVPQDNILSSEGLTWSSYKKGKTELRTARYATSLADHAGYADLQEHTLLDITRPDSPTSPIEHYILLSPKEALMTPSKEDLLLKSDEGKEYHLKWPPEKLGDGSYGIVFKVHDDRRSYALKILYERQFATRTGLMSVSQDYMKCINNTDVSKADDGETTSNIHFADFLDGIFRGLEARIRQEPSKMNASIAEVRKLVDTAMQCSDEATSLAKRRFAAEKNVTVDIYNHLKTQRESQKRERENGEQQPRWSAAEEIVPAHYVEVEASFSSFKSTKGGQTLRRFFLEKSNKEGRSFSNFAVVMQFCTHTLKDLLEKEWIFTNGDNGPKLIAAAGHPSNLEQTMARGQQEGSRLIGYSIIEALRFEDRVRLALLFMIGAARGLRTLHSADKMHHDIKPGNVFIKINDSSFDVLLGDFSFVAQAAEAGTTEAVLRDVIGTGTPHFRSPEQRDFAEIYQAKVLHCYGPGQDFALCITDPKFDRSISSPRDRVVFSSDNDGRLFTIRSIERDELGLVWFLKLVEGSEDLRCSFPEAKKPTQIIIYKMPSLSSDVFGFGALFWDLISAGRSAERFYEALRAIDYSGSPFTVDEIVNGYKEFCQTGLIEGKYQALREVYLRFAPNHKEDYCPVEVVKLIVQCTTFKIHGSFELMMDKDGLPSSQSPVTKILDVLDELDTTYHSRDSVNHVLINPMKSLLWPKLSKSLANRSKKGDQPSLEAGRGVAADTDLELKPSWKFRLLYPVSH
jgi:serine/threonine protein kinase